MANLLLTALIFVPKRTAASVPCSSVEHQAGEWTYFTQPCDLEGQNTYTKLLVNTSLSTTAYKNLVSITADSITITSNGEINGFGGGLSLSDGGEGSPSGTNPTLSGATYGGRGGGSSSVR